jgi:hypothetical protein
MENSDPENIGYETARLLKKYGLPVIIILALLFMLIQRGDEISNLKYEISNLKKEKDQLVQDTKRELEDVNKKLHEANKREVPVSIRFRPVIFGNGYYASITNRSGQAIDISIVIERPRSGKTKNLEIVIDGSGTKEIGEDEGWAFMSGDSVTVSHSEYKALIWTMG